jgi:DNA-binding SARP family transcriptional activator
VLDFRLLGPVGLWADDQRIGLGPTESAKARCLLAVLLRTPGMLVTTDALVDRVWGDRPPGPAVRYKYVGWLRSALAPYGVALTSRDEGYTLEIDPESVDLHRFRRLHTAARRSLDTPGMGTAAGSGLLDEALGLWRGPAMAGVSGTWAQSFRDQLELERRDARALWARCELAAGRHEAAVERLADWESEYPADEEIVALRMLALYRHGARTQALDCYDGARQRLRDLVGAQPGADLRTMWRRIRDGDPTLAAAADGEVSHGTSPDAAPHGAATYATAAGRPAGRRPAAVPRQLPAAMPYFVGRGAELEVLDALLDRTSADGRRSTVVISAIGGSAGIGKTALAVHWAHRVADRFPDGQLFVNLRGFDPGGRPVAPEDAIHWLLGALGVEPTRVPADPQARAALYRSTLAGRHVLIVLDNARGAEQVRPLLPGSPTCLVVITSRDELAALVATEGARPLALDLPTAYEARELLARRLGADRIAAEPRAVDALIALCERLPLALSITAARAAVRPGRPLEQAADELRDARRLDALNAGDAPTDLRAVFSWSYRALDARAARMFRLLGLHPGPDISLPAAASLAGSPLVARSALEGLVRAHLIGEQRLGRFTLHDLLRAYAVEQAQQWESSAAGRAATRRALDHYLHTAYRAALLLHPPRDPLDLAAPAAGVTPEPLAGHDAAMAWFEGEHQVLLALVDLGARERFETHSWQLAWTMVDFLQRRGHWRDWADTQRTALAATRRLGDVRSEARVHVGLGLALMRLGSYDEAQTHLRRGLDLHRELGDPTGQAHCHSALAWLRGRAGAHAEALRHAALSLELFERLGHRVGVARAHSAVGWYHALLEQHARALAHGERSVESHRELGDDFGEAGAWDGIGYSHHRLGDHARAAASYDRALKLYRRIGDRYQEAATLVRLGDVRRETGEPKGAHDAWQRAVAILDELGHADADAVRGKLQALDVTDWSPSG